MKTLLFFVPVLLVMGCDKKSSSNNKVNYKTAQAQVTYTESTTDFPNPERGFYRYSETNVDNYSPLNAATLTGFRTGQSVFGTAYSVISTLVFRYFVLKGYNGKALPASFLSNIAKDCATARAAGVKLIPRFTYTVTATPGSCSEQFICKPYGDAPKSIVLNHIAQLKQVLQDNADVIACVQLGFIGTWGENYYTDYFGDASSNGQGQLYDNNWNDRAEVLKAMLGTLPADRMVQVRYPQIKQRYVYGVNAPASSAALTLEEAALGTDKSRIGFHNDCFLASANDYGTYADYGNSSSAPKEATTAFRNYYKMDSKFVVVGGETCSDEYSPQNDCEPAGHAEQEFGDMHYSFLNADYNADVNNDWQTGGCLNNIKRKLGYRLALKDATFQLADSLYVIINLQNSGYAAPFNPRPVQLVLRNTSSGQIYELNFNTEVRKWLTGVITLQKSFALPAGIMAGNYDLLLNLPDKYPTLKTKPAFSIRLANDNVWEDNTGYNKLNYSITVK